MKPVMKRGMAGGMRPRTEALSVEEEEDPDADDESEEKAMKKKSRTK